MKFNKKIFYRILKIILVIIIFVVISFTNGKNRKVTFIEELFGEIVMLPQKGITYLKNIMNEDNTNNGHSNKLKIVKNMNVFFFLLSIVIAPARIYIKNQIAKKAITIILINVSILASCSNP